mgnify:CR=1 FL=1
MNNNLKSMNPPRPKNPRTKVVRFWTEGKMAESAYERLNQLRAASRDDEARVLLNEWIL